MKKAFLLNMFFPDDVVSGIVSNLTIFPKIDISPLKMNGWKTSFLLCQGLFFKGLSMAML